MQHWFRLDSKGEKEYFTDLSQFPEGTFGFVYIITNKSTGKFYVGKKVLRNNLSKKLTKKEISEWSKPGRVPKKRKEVKESNWKEYWGSNKDLVEEVKKIGPDKYDRRILQICKASKQMTYFETLWQLHYDVLCVDSFNQNILGKFFRRDVEGTCGQTPRIHQVSSKI